MHVFGLCPRVTMIKHLIQNKQHVQNIVLSKNKGNNCSGKNVPDCPALKQTGFHSVVWNKWNNPHIGSFQPQRMVSSILEEDGSKEKSLKKWALFLKICTTIKTEMALESVFKVHVLQSVEKLFCFNTGFHIKIMKSSPLECREIRRCRLPTQLGKSSRQQIAVV